VYGYGFDQKEQEKMANMLNCSLGTLPMKYLGIPISDCRLKSSTSSTLWIKWKKARPMEG
jgi:hypothetical protein